MNREDIIAWAREAGLTPDELALQFLERFAALVAAAVRKDADYRLGLLIQEEREACAKVCDETLAQHYMKQTIPERDEALFLAACADCAAAIRARGG